VVLEQSVDVRAGGMVSREARLPVVAGDRICRGFDPAEGSASVVTRNGGAVPGAHPSFAADAEIDAPLFAYTDGRSSVDSIR